MPGVERDQDKTTSRHRQVELEIAMAVRPDDGHSVAANQTDRTQRTDQSLGALVELSVREPLRTADNGDLGGGDAPTPFHGGDK